MGSVIALCKHDAAQPELIAKHTHAMEVMHAPPTTGFLLGHPPHTPLAKLVQSWCTTEFKTCWIALDFITCSVPRTTQAAVPPRPYKVETERERGREKVKGLQISTC